MNEAHSYLCDMIADETGVREPRIEWDERMPLLGKYQPDGQPVRGAWVLSGVFSTPRCGDHGRGCMSSWTRDRKVLPYFIMDGNNGMPLEPGRWVIEQLNAHDPCKHGLREVARFEDDMREARVRVKQQGRARLAEMVKHDDRLFRGLAKAKEELGVATATGEEALALEKEAAAVAEWNEAQRAAERREVRFNDGL